MTENTKVTCYWLFGILFVCTILLFFWGYWQYNKGENIYKNISYSIGTLVLNNGPSHGRYTSSSPAFFFNFSIDNQIFNDVESLGFQLVDWNKGIVGSQYLVVYDKTNPQNAIILLDYPIKDTATFDKYMEGFKINPLNITPYFRMNALFFLKDYSKD